MARREEPSNQSEDEPPTWDLRSNEGKSCEVHGLPLQAGLAEIAYGLFEFDEVYWANKQELFPNSNRWVLGGCVSSRADVAQVDYCSLCREVEGGWEEVKKLLSTV